MRKGLLFLSVILISLVGVVPVFADAPATGLVHEGQGVPGINLGFTRAQVEMAYGTPDFCQSVEVSGDMAACSFPVNGGGQVDVRYLGADGGNAANSPNDIVFNIRWSEQVSGWITTAGVYTTLAKNNPDAVIAAYPDAQIVYSSFGEIYSIIDANQGIEIVRAFDFYTGEIHVSMAIFAPRPPAPDPVQSIHVESVDLTATKQRGQRIISGLVQVQNEQQLAAAGATVSATWTFPDGSTQDVQGITSSSGYTVFQLSGRLDRGTYTLTINDVILADHEFDITNSELSASIDAR